MVAVAKLAAVALVAAAGSAGANDDDAADVYGWAIGVDLFGGGGRIGNTDSGMYSYGHLAGGIRAKADVPLASTSPAGAEVYVQLAHVGKGPPTIYDTEPPLAYKSTLDILDIGLALYRHVPIARGVSLTPLFGASLARMDPQDGDPRDPRPSYRYAALGGRAELAASLALGAHHEHAVSVMMAVHLYTGVLSEPAQMAGPSAAQLALDAGGSFVYLGAGYAYRFDAHRE